jgi:hypothetical protein
MPKLTDGRLIGHGLTAQINPHKLSHGAGIIQRLFDRWIRQVEPLLQAMEAQHALDAHRWPTRPAGLGIHRFDYSHQLGPRHHAVHHIKESFPTGRLPLRLNAGIGKGLLLHGGSPIE